MTRSVDIAEFNLSDGLTPRQVGKLNHNFRQILRQLPQFMEGESSGGGDVPEDIADYIIEHHVAESEDEWNWCKWASGKSEAWKNYDLYVDGWTSWGSMYESDQYANSLAFPNGLFIETPAPDLRLRYSDGGYALSGFENAGNGSTSQSHNLYLLRPTSASATTWHLFIYYLGRWQ